MPALRRSHFPDPPQASLRPRSGPLLNTEGSQMRTFDPLLGAQRKGPTCVLRRGPPPVGRGPGLCHRHTTRSPCRDQACSDRDRARGPATAEVTATISTLLAVSRSVVSISSGWWRLGTWSRASTIGRQASQPSSIAWPGGSALLTRNSGCGSGVRML
jgi:hypothetical protein